MEETWKDVEGYEGLYQVSNLGRVKSLERYVIRGRGGISKVRERILKCGHDKDGYSCVALMLNGKRTTFRVHRLVAQAFIPNPENKPFVNHINEDKTNNHAKNLEWCTCKENNNHGTRNERMAKTQGKPIIGIALKDGEVLAFEYASQAEKYGFDKSHIHKVCKGILKQHKGYVWKYIKPI